MHAFRSYIFC